MNEPEPIVPYAEYPRALPGPSDSKRVSIARALSASSIVAGVVTVALMAVALLVENGYVAENWLDCDAPWFILASWVLSLWIGGRRGIPSRPSVVLASVGGSIIFMLLFAQISFKVPPLLILTGSGALLYGVLSGVAARHVKRSLPG